MKCQRHRSGCEGEAIPGKTGCAHCLKVARKYQRAHAPRRLPLASGWTSLFRAGEGGERRECANYERCLDAFQGTGPAYCPEGCPREEPPGEMPRATDYMSIDGGARGA